MYRYSRAQTKNSFQHEKEDAIEPARDPPLSTSLQDST